MLPLHHTLYCFYFYPREDLHLQKLDPKSNASTISPLGLINIYTLKLSIIKKYYFLKNEKTEVIGVAPISTILKTDVFLLNYTSFDDKPFYSIY